MLLPTHVSTLPLAILMFLLKMWPCRAIRDYSITFTSTGNATADDNCGAGDHHLRLDIHETLVVSVRISMSDRKKIERFRVHGSNYWDDKRDGKGGKGDSEKAVV